MPSKKKKYNARFPAGRIKKIMQTDEEVGKVAQAVPVIISRTLELFVESLLTKSMNITMSRNAKTLTPSHMKQCILSESRFDFLKDLVKNIPDASIQEDNENNAIEAIDYSTSRSVEEEDPNDKPEIVANFYMEQSTSTVRTPVIQYSPKIGNPTIRDNEDMQVETVPTVRPLPSLIPMGVPKLNFSVESLVKQDPKIQLPVPDLVPTHTIMSPPSLIPAPLNLISHNNSNTSDSLYIDEDYDN